MEQKFDEGKFIWIQFLFGEKQLVPLNLKVFVFIGNEKSFYASKICVSAMICVE